MQQNKKILGVGDNIQRAEEELQKEKSEETVLENIDDNPYNDTPNENEEILIQKAAKRCKMSVEGFKKVYETAEGKTVIEKIDDAEETINEQFRGNDGRNRV